jgi:hypothetical protein
VLLAVVFVLSAFLDNIAAALIGGTMASHVFRDDVDRRRQPARRNGSRSAGGDRLCDFRHTSGDPAASLLSDREGPAARGVAVSNMYPEAKSVGRWLRHGWYIPIAYVVGFFALLVIPGWHPDAPHD